MHCPKCGIRNSDIAKSCSFCGGELPIPYARTRSQRPSLKQAMPPKRDMNRRAKIVASAAFIFIALLIVAAAAMNLSSSGGSSNVIPINNIPNIALANNSTSQIKAPGDINLSGSARIVTVVNTSDQISEAQTNDSSSNQAPAATTSTTNVSLPENTSTQTPTQATNETSIQSNSSTSDNLPLVNQTSNSQSGTSSSNNTTNETSSGATPENQNGTPNNSTSENQTLPAALQTQNQTSNATSP